MFWSVKEPLSTIRLDVCLPDLKCVLCVFRIIGRSGERTWKLCSPPTSRAASTQQLFKWWINISQSLLCCALGCGGPSPNNRFLTCIIHPSLIHSSLTQTHGGIQLSQTKLQIRKPFKTSAPPSCYLRGTLSRLLPSLMMLTMLNNASPTRISLPSPARNPSVWANINKCSKQNSLGLLAKRFPIYGDSSDFTSAWWKKKKSHLMCKNHPSKISNTDLSLGVLQSSLNLTLGIQ